MARARIAVHKFTSCDGCQLTFLNCEAELLALAEMVEIAYFAEVSSRLAPGPYDVAFVEGSVSTPEEARRIQKIREEARILVAIGACATAGGIQALRNFRALGPMVQAVYPTPEVLEVLPQATPIGEHVPVDLELHGCPISKSQLLEVLPVLLEGRVPRIPGHPVCVDCKRLGNPCVVVRHRIPCLGPVTRTGCGALCPTYGRGCYGCFGPSDAPQIPAAFQMLEELGLSREAASLEFQRFTGWARPFREASRQGTTSEPLDPGNTRGRGTA